MSAASTISLVALTFAALAGRADAQPASAPAPDATTLEQLASRWWPLH